MLYPSWEEKRNVFLSIQSLREIWLPESPWSSRNGRFPAAFDSIQSVSNIFYYPYPTSLIRCVENPPYDDSESKIITINIQNWCQNNIYLCMYILFFRYSWLFDSASKISSFSFLDSSVSVPMHLPPSAILGEKLFPTETATFWEKNLAWNPKGKLKILHPY